MSFATKSLLLEQPANYVMHNPLHGPIEDIVIHSKHHANKAWKPSWKATKKTTNSWIKNMIIQDKTTTKKNITPSDTHITDAITHALIDNDSHTISFTRYEDEPVVDYLLYTGIIQKTQPDNNEYDQLFRIDPTIWLSYINKYKTTGKRIELLIAEYPMIGAWVIGTTAAVIAWVVLWFVNFWLDLLFKSF